MIIYFAVPLVALLEGGILGNSKISIKGRNINIKLFLFMAFILPIVIFGFRDDSIGIDTNVYVKEFQQIDQISFFDILNMNYSGNIIDDVEVGFSMMNWIIAKISKSPKVFLLVTSLLINILYARAIYYLSPMPLTSTLAYFFLSNFLYNLNVMRQGIAAGIILNAMIYLTKKNYIRYFALVLIAAMFHTFSVVFFFMIFPVINIKSWKSLAISLAGVFFAVLYSLDFVHILVLRYFPHFDYYFRNNYHSDQRFGVTSCAYVCLDIIIVFLLLLEFKRSEARKNIIIICTIALTIGAASLLMMPVFGIYERISKFFHTFLLISVACGLSGIKSIQLRQVLNLGFIVFSFIYYTYILYIDAYHIVPFLVNK